MLHVRLRPTPLLLCARTTELAVCASARSSCVVGNFTCLLFSAPLQVEQFFIEALESCKAAIAEERNAAYVNATAAFVSSIFKKKGGPSKCLFPRLSL